MLVSSVIGTKKRKFAPHLSAIIHHGSDRTQDEQEFKTASLAHDLAIASFTLARKDAKLFKSFT